MAKTARCFGAPNGSRTPCVVISSGPRTPNPSPEFLIAPRASRMIEVPDLGSSAFELYCDHNAPVIGIFTRRHWNRCPLKGGERTLGDHLVEQCHHPLDSDVARHRCGAGPVVRLAITLDPILGGCGHGGPLPGVRWLFARRLRLP